MKSENADKIPEEEKAKIRYTHRRVKQTKI